MKISRNAPCPCGSGKKFKKCCILTKVTAPEELDYRRLHEVHDRLFDRLLRVARRVYGEASMLVAWEEYFLWPHEEDGLPDAALMDRHMQLFSPWFVFNWEYNPLDAAIELEGPSERTMAELYAEEQGSRLDSIERRFIAAVNRKPYTFYEILEVNPGRTIQLRDIMTGSRILVQERTASHHVKVSDIVFGRAVTIDGVGMIVGLSSYVMPPRIKPMIIEFRGELAAAAGSLSEEVLIDMDMELRELYLDIDRFLFAPPRISNTDGDKLQFHKVVYDIDSADAAFEKLVTLCVTRKAVELRQEAERDADGHIRRAEILWDRKGSKARAGLPATILGRIMIDGDRLTAEVNSAKRARTIRRKIEARLGAGARFRIEEIRSLDAMLKDEDMTDLGTLPSPEHEALMQDPEFRRQAAELMRRHWESWVDMEIPALGGRTPREAVKDKDGKEAVEALLADAERGGEHDPHMAEMNRAGARLARQLLGLTGSPAIEQ